MTGPDATPGPEGRVALTIDAVGKRCPMPVIELGQRIGEVAVGEVVSLVTDDPAAAADVAAWCRMREQDYLGEAPAPGSAAGPGTAYLVRRLH